MSDTAARAPQNHSIVDFLVSQGLDASKDKRAEYYALFVDERETYIRDTRQNLALLRAMIQKQDLLRDLVAEQKTGKAAKAPKTPRDKKGTSPAPKPIGDKGEKTPKVVITSAPPEHRPSPTVVAPDNVAPKANEPVAPVPDDSAEESLSVKPEPIAGSSASPADQAPAKPAPTVVVVAGKPTPSTTDAPARRPATNTPTPADQAPAKPAPTVVVVAGKPTPSTTDAPARRPATNTPTPADQAPAKPASTVVVVAGKPTPSTTDAPARRPATNTPTPADQAPAKPASTVVVVAGKPSVPVQPRPAPAPETPQKQVPVTGTKRVQSPEHAPERVAETPGEALLIAARKYTGHPFDTLAVPNGDGTYELRDGEGRYVWRRNGKVTLYDKGASQGNEAAKYPGQAVLLETDLEPIVCIDLLVRAAQDVGLMSEGALSSADERRVHRVEPYLQSRRNSFETIHVSGATYENIQSGAFKFPPLQVGDMIFLDKRYSRHSGIVSEVDAAGQPTKIFYVNSENGTGDFPLLAEKARPDAPTQYVPGSGFIFPGNSVSSILRPRPGSSYSA